MLCYLIEIDVLNNIIMKKRLLKRSDVLREGYVKGLKKA